jgi:hypothetical protein
MGINISQESKLNIRLEISLVRKCERREKEEMKAGKTQAKHKIGNN